nr:homeobox-leucine zipper protein HAT9-like [Ipomoea batatas]
MLFIFPAMAEDDQKLDLRLGLGNCTLPKEDNSPKKTSGFGVSLDLSFPSHSNDQSGDIIESSKTYEVEGMESQNSYSTKSHSGLMRKKLRLNKEQSALLEECFKHHTTLTMGRKHELATKLNLRPRQVEVWFQNRRARTKLKQTEVDCNLLKKYCESLNYENCRLKRELQELRSSFKFDRPPQPFSDQPPKAKTTATCPSCEKTTGLSGAGSDHKDETELVDTVLELKTDP